MKTNKLSALLLIAIASLVAFAPLAHADTLFPSDFSLTSFAKTIDYFDYVRTYAEGRNLSVPVNDTHAWLYMTYINTSGIKLLYAGLDNITFGGNLTFTIPVQSFIMHYRTDNQSRDVILGNTFLMLLAFNDTDSSLFSNSPDRNDLLWASFSMGVSIAQLNDKIPVFSSRIEHLPLVGSNNNLTWTWGMRYTNLTAFWWPMSINRDDPHFVTNVTAVTVYDELTFNYQLNIDPATNTTTITENHVIGRMRELFWQPYPFLWVRYNATGTYGIEGRLKLGNETIYQFLDKYGIKMSIVDYQTAVTVGHETVSRAVDGQNVTDTDTFVDGTSVDTVTDDGVKIATANFGAKQTYRLYNYTQDNSEGTFSTYNATQRTAQLYGFAHNDNLFQLQFGLLRLLPLVVYYMFPGMYMNALASFTDITRANYLYIVAYPVYSGYRVVHDPTLTVYAAVTGSPENPWSPTGYGGLVIIAAIVIVVIITAALVLRRRGKPSQTQPRRPLTSNSFF